MLDRKGALRALDERPKERRIFDLVEEALRGSRRRMATVNVGKIDRLAGERSVFVVPGKVLGTGEVRKKLSVGAISFSEEARRKIQKAGGEALDIASFLKKYSKKEGIVVVGG
jgi:large subunit ribosomal protein L18e